MLGCQEGRGGELREDRQWDPGWAQERGTPDPVVGVPQCDQPPVVDGQAFLSPPCSGAGVLGSFGGYEGRVQRSPPDAPHPAASIREVPGLCYLLPATMFAQRWGGSCQKTCLPAYLRSPARHSAC